MEAGISASPPTTSSTSSLDAPLLVPTRQSKFWFQDGSIILHVENATYKVHRSVLESYSSVLRERFSKACHDGIQRSQGEGQVPSVKLEDVSNNDFMQFLALLYPRDFQDRESLTPTQWSSLLTMSHTFQIPSLRKLAISFISSTASDVDKIAFGHMHGVKEWLLPSYDALANRNDPLTVEEGWRLGVDVVVRIAKARELRLTLGERWSEVGGEVLRRIFEDLELPLEGAGIDADM
ncbi:hypothetical protein BD410DRAFT_769370 [Rickenella mellea]|uniref:BTB domain-containing protein n=1 Tax=Rickenella mellea TaxID=50990 RepID=A0A4Y7Q7U7_9AGAM|nr:hypothetical protein BD410DRAFT_769370 [Rickenella mellea]